MLSQRPFFSNVYCGITIEINTQSQIYSAKRSYQLVGDPKEAVIEVPDQGGHSVQCPVDRSERHRGLFKVQRNQCRRPSCQLFLRNTFPALQIVPNCCQSFPIASNLFAYQCAITYRGRRSAVKSVGTEAICFLASAALLYMMSVCRRTSAGIFKTVQALWGKDTALRISMSQ